MTTVSTLNVSKCLCTGPFGACCFWTSWLNEGTITDGINLKLIVDSGETVPGLCEAKNKVDAPNVTNILLDLLAAVLDTVTI